MATTYMVAKTINVVLMTVALIPVYFWSRRLMRPVYAVVATALVALLPAFVYTGTIMTENGSFPATILAFFAIAWMLERPTLLRQLLALAVVGLAFFVRAQSLVLFVVLPLAVIVKLLLDARVADPGARRRAFVRGWRAYLPLVAIYLFVAVGYGLFQAARGVPLNRGLGAYGGVASAQYSVGDVASWTLEHAAELGLAVAIFPVSALIVLTVLAVSRGANDAAERAFLAVATSAVFIVVVQVAAFASRFSLRVEERYMFFVVPLLFMALALWLDRGLPRPVVTTAVATAVPGAVASRFAAREAPQRLDHLGHVRLHSAAPALVPLLDPDRALADDRGSGSRGSGVRSPPAPLRASRPPLGARALPRADDGPGLPDGPRLRAEHTSLPRAWRS